MEYTKNVWVPATQKKVTHNLSPCLKCGGDDLKITEYDDKYGFISTVTCKGCTNHLTLNCNEDFVIKNWNKLNSIPELIVSKGVRIVELQNEIKELKVLFKTRQKKTFKPEPIKK